MLYSNIQICWWTETISTFMIFMRKKFIISLILKIDIKSKTCIIYIVGKIEASIPSEKIFWKFYMILKKIIVNWGSNFQSTTWTSSKGAFQGDFLFVSLSPRQKETHLFSLSPRQKENHVFSLSPRQIENHNFS